MSILTVADIMRKTRYRYNAADDTFFSDSELMDYIFDGCAILAKDGWVIERTYSVPGIEGERVYTYPVTTLAVREARFNYKKLRKVDFSFDPRTDKNIKTGTPTQYAIWQNRIWLYPAPDTDGSIDDDENRINYLEIKVYKYPDDIDDDESDMEIPEEYKEDIITYVLKCMSFKDQNLPLLDRMTNEWEKIVHRAKKQRMKRLRADRLAKTKDYYFGSDCGGTYF